MDYWFIFALAAIGIAVLGVVQWHRHKQKVGELAAFAAQRLVTWSKGSLETEKLLGMLDYLCEILEQVPSFVWKP